MLVSIGNHLVNRRLKAALDVPPSSQEAMIASDESDREWTESEWEEEEIEPATSPAPPSSKGVKNPFKKSTKRKHKLKVVQLSSNGTLGFKAAERWQKKQKGREAARRGNFNPSKT
jgi:hypothetical protein